MIDHELRFNENQALIMDNYIWTVWGIEVGYLALRLWIQLLDLYLDIAKTKGFL